MDFYVKLVSGDYINIILDEKDTYEDVIRKVNIKCDSNYTINNISNEDLEYSPQTIGDELILKYGYELEIDDLKNRNLWNIESFIVCNDVGLIPVYLTQFDVNCKNRDENTALMMACRKKNIEKVDILLKTENIDLNIQNSTGDTALIITSVENDIEIMNLLLKCPDIDINIQNKIGNTALILACCRNRIKVVELLLNRLDIDIYKKNYYNNDALVMSRHWNHNKLVEMILKRIHIDIMK